MNYVARPVSDVYFKSVSCNYGPLWASVSGGLGYPVQFEKSTSALQVLRAQPGGLLSTSPHAYSSLPECAAVQIRCWKVLSEEVRR